MDRIDGCKRQGAGDAGAAVRAALGFVLQHRPRLPRTTGRLACVAVAAALSVTLAPAKADEAAARGERIVDQWCRLCHLRAGDPPDPDMAPPYEDIVRRPGRDEAYFVRFLEGDHFPMTIYRLFDDEKRDVVAYLLSLQSM